MKRPMRCSVHRQRGFSLVEIIIVVGIIGVLVAVTIPQFGTMMKGYQMRTAVTKFTSDLRAVRQLAVTQSAWTRVSFKEGAAGTYLHRSSISRDRGASWEPLPDRYTSGIDWNAKISADSVTDITDANGDTLHDVIFLPNGTVTATSDGTIRFRYNQNFPNNQFTVTVRPNGAVVAQVGTY